MKCSTVSSSPSSHRVDRVCLKDELRTGKPANPAHALSARDDADLCLVTRIPIEKRTAVFDPFLIADHRINDEDNVILRYRKIVHHRRIRRIKAFGAR